MPQFRALVLVATRAGINAGGIATALDIHPSNATRLLDRLVQAGLLDRRDSPVDRRHVELTLTREGMRLVEAVMAHRRSAFARVLQAMKPADRRRLSRSLTVFADAADEPYGHVFIPL
jgi:DNA-binding MarR family transcriptional regulator